MEKGTKIVNWKQDFFAPYNSACSYERGIC